MTSQSQSGSVELYGLPFSTFTRSICMGLTELSIPYKHHTDVAPHSGAIEKLNPFGLLPALVHQDAAGAGGDIVLWEANAVRRYIDEALAGPSASPLTPASDAHLRARVDQLVSIASSTLFNVVEHGIVKPRLAKEEAGDDEEKIRGALQEGEASQKLRETLEIVESLGKKEGKEYFLSEKGPTWGDLFMYPALADLRSIPEVRQMRSDRRLQY